MTAAKQPSITPILDLLKPFPDPDREAINGRFAFPFLTLVALIVMTGNLSFLLVPFGFLLINFITILIHELGHLIGGWCVGLRFRAVRIDPFRVRIDSGKWKFRVQPRLFWGFALMSFDRVRRVRTRLIALVAGGPLASIVSGVTAVIAGEIGLARYDSPWPTFFDFFGAWSIFIGCVGLFPYRVRGYASDGMLLRALLFRRPEATQIVASYALFTVKNDGLFLPDYFRRWFKLASVQTRLQKDNYYANWLAYENAEDPGIAAQFLERCLAEAARMDAYQRDKLIIEAAVFSAWRRGDAVRAELWVKRIQSPDRVHPFWRTRVNISLLCAQQQFENAMAELDRGLSLLRDAPDGAERQRFEAGWISWREQIQQRIPIQAAN
jgi:hypothetical protein